MTFTRRHCLAVLGAGLAKAANKPLMDEWRKIAAGTDGTVGAAALHLPSGQHVALNGQVAYPLASVCKLPIAMHILQMVDDGKLRLDQEIEIVPQDVWHSWEGDIGERWVRQHRWKLDDLIRLMVAESDNTAVHTLFRIGGTAGGMANSFGRWKVKGVRVDRYEGECYLASHGVANPPPFDQWRPGLLEELVRKTPLHQQAAGMRKLLADPRDTGTPEATVELLARAFRGELLSPGGTQRLKQVLEATSTGKARLKGLLPPDTAVAHKTGSTSTVNGLNGATNDVGVMLLPVKAGQLAIAVYVKGSTRSETIREQVIARIARVAYDRWTA